MFIKESHNANINEAKAKKRSNPVGETFYFTFGAEMHAVNQNEGGQWSFVTLSVTYYGLPNKMANEYTATTWGELTGALTYLFPSH